MKNPDKQVQLTLNPKRGFGLLALGELLVDFRSGQPFFANERAAAERFLAGLRQPMFADFAQVVPVHLHEVPGQRPTYVVENGALS